MCLCLLWCMFFVCGVCLYLSVICAYVCFVCVCGGCVCAWWVCLLCVVWRVMCVWGGSPPFPHIIVPAVASLRS